MTGQFSNDKTKIICTIGPASRSEKIISSLIDGGMDVVRLNFSHAIYEEAKETIGAVRRLALKKKKTVAILQDLQGLKIRVGDLAEPITVRVGEKYIFSTATVLTKKSIPVQYKNFAKDVKVGDRILVADGAMRFIALRKGKDFVEAKAVVGGEIKSRKGINLPDTKVSAGALTVKDKKDIAFGVAQKVDFIALSFVQNDKDIKDVRSIVKKLGAATKIIAKIELPEAVKNLEEIIHASDGVMVARGDLGVEFPPQKVPLLQKKIIRTALRHGRPVITATQMLMSMVERPVPTRAEVNDVANAILDRTDAVMLSDETASGKYPLEAVRMMQSIIEETEREQSGEQFSLPLKKEELEMSIPATLGMNAIYLARDLKVKYIVVFTESGFSALQVARFRSAIPMIVFTLSEQVKKELAMVWGINEVAVLDSFDDKFLKATAWLQKQRKIHSGDKVLIISAWKKLKDGILSEIRVFECK